MKFNIPEKSVHQYDIYTVARIKQEQKSIVLSLAAGAQVHVTQIKNVRLVCMNNDDIMMV